MEKGEKKDRGREETPTVTENCKRDHENFSHHGNQAQACGLLF
jgi:hypothetical protein